MVRFMGRVAAGVLLLGLAACSRAPATPQATPASGAPPAVEAAPALAPQTAPATAVAREPLRLVYATRDGGVVPLWLAAEAGLYARYGIDAALRYVSSGTLSMQALLAGEADAGITAASAVVAAGLSGADTIYIGAIQRTFGFWVVATPEVASPAALRGKRIGITRRNSTSDVALQYYLRQLGLSPQSDVAVVEVGEHAAMLSALQSGAIQAAVTSSPTNVVAVRHGARELADLTQLGVEYPQSTLVTTRRFASEHRDLVLRFLRAVWEATYLYKTDRALALQVMRQYLQSDDEELLAAVYDTYTSRLVQDVPRAYLEGTRTILAELAATTPGAQDADPTRFLDTSFQETLDREGLEARLYGR
jgi:NitT/TauT family transport system substrate-binding protein